MHYYYGFSMIIFVTGFAKTDLIVDFKKYRFEILNGSIEGWGGWEGVGAGGEP